MTYNQRWHNYAIDLDDEILARLPGPRPSWQSLRFDAAERKISTANHRWLVGDSSIAYERYSSQAEAWRPKRDYPLDTSAAALAEDIVVTHRDIV